MFSYFWPADDISSKKNDEVTRDEAKKYLISMFEKHDKSQLKTVDTLLDDYANYLGDLMIGVKATFEKSKTTKSDVTVIRAKLREHYMKHNKAKVHCVEELLSRFKGKEEELLAEITQKYPSNKTDNLDIVSQAPINEILNTSLPIHLQTKRIYHSGYLWQKTSGWLSTKQRTWCILVCQQLYIGDSPNSTSHVIVPLLDSKISDEPNSSDDEYTFKVTHPGMGDFMFFTSNEFEKLLWTVKLEISSFQANPHRCADAEARAMYQKVFTEYPPRPCVPFYSLTQDGLDALPEKLDEFTLKGYLVTSTGESWVGDNWGRRYVTLHDCWFTVRPDKSSSKNLLILPLRDADLEVKDDSFSLWSDYIPNITIAPDSEEKLKTYLTAFRAAIAKANPDRDEQPEIVGGNKETKTTKPVTVETTNSAPAEADNKKKPVAKTAVARDDDEIIEKV